MGVSSTPLRQQILEISRTLPATPKILAELGALVRDVDVPLACVAELIKRDAPLSADVIRMSNSVVYRHGDAQPVGSVEEALQRIGFSEIYRLVSLVATGRLADRRLVHYGVSLEALRGQMLHTAIGCEVLAGAAGLDTREAYTAGLMRNLGMMVLDRVADRLTGVASYQPEEDIDYLAWEARMFGISSSELGALLLAEWDFPAVIVGAVQNHGLRRDPDYENPMAAVVHLAAGIAAEAGLALAGEDGLWVPNARKLEAAGLNERQFRDSARRVRTGFDDGADVAGKPQATGGSSDGGPRVAPFLRRLQDVFCNSGTSGRVLGMNDDPPVQTPTAGPMTPVDFTTFMRNYQDMVYTTAVRLLNNEAQAEDISQEVFLKAYERFDDLRSSPTAGGWLKTVTTNLSINHLQRYRKRWRFFSEIVRPHDEGDENPEPVEFASPDSDFLAGVNQAERRAWVERALEKLPEHQRVPLVLYHFEDLPYDDIAKKLGVSLAKVKTDILRGRAALAQILARSGASHETFSARS
ncbi:MAG TPA: sigma-70 family RNA polymerase sigma factor [Opitutaceae bacterium]